jgi:hypothetical protein
VGAELYDVVASGLRSGIPWEVGVTRRGSLILSIGTETIALADAERDRYAEAVACAVTPGQGER